MGIGVRAFFVTDVGVSRVAFYRVERLLCGHSQEIMPGCAGQRMRCALAYIEFVNRRAVAVRHVDYLVLPFASDGRLDRTERRRSRALMMASAQTWSSTVSEPVVEFGPHLAARRYRTEFKWVPTAVEVNALVGQALKGRGRG